MIKKKQKEQKEKSVLLDIEIINPVLSHSDRWHLIVTHGDVEI